MAYIDLFAISKNYDIKQIFTAMDFHLAEGERVAIVGQNGCGKSTLMKISLGSEEPDDGKRIIDRSIQIEMLDQQPHFDPELSTKEAISKELTELHNAKERYDELSQQISIDYNNKALQNELEAVGAYLDHHNAWDLSNKIERVMQEFRLKEYEDRLVSSLSGGEQRRVALASLILKKPEVLMLDEPTNHLDVYMVEFLEEILLKEKFTLLFISHDRYFIDRIATRIVEVENQALVSYKGGYRNFLHLKDQRLQAMQKQHHNLIRFLRKEEDWLSRGVKARQTRNQGRKKRVFELREQAQDNPTLIRSMKIELDRERKAFMGEKVVSKKKMLFEIKNLNFSIANKHLIKDFTSRILQKDKIAIVGHNGSGKSTLLKLLLGRLKPDSGSIKRGDVRIGYFDQHREMLNDEHTLIETFCPNAGDRVMVDGKNMHVYGYLKNFLFPKDYLDKRIGQLSGGERNRVALALLFTKEIDCLILDEPTNDLDIQTINILEEKLLSFQGAVIFVSHDRYFVDKIAEKLLVFKGAGTVEESYQTYSDYLTLEKDMDLLYGIEKEITQQAKPTQAVDTQLQKQAKLSYKDQRDLEILPRQIEGMEREIESLHKCTYDPKCYEEEGLVNLSKRLAKLEVAYEQTSERYLEVLELEEEINNKA
ncbi:MAG: ABC-F family ATP-binding cassette domain-containing protein [Sulfurovum sp.]|nr:ABC-F family ATP-binding cassette domain-containing protein [Sulfurovum sp.]